MHVLGITMSASLRCSMLSLTSAVLSGMFGYHFDHREKQLEGLPVGWSFQNNPYFMVQWDLFLRIISNSVCAQELRK